MKRTMYQAARHTPKKDAAYHIFEESKVSAGLLRLQRHDHSKDGDRKNRLTGRKKKFTKS